MLTQFNIENFRGIRSLALKDLARVNILVGKNNCGKSSVLEALLLFANPAKAENALAIGKHRYINLRDNTILKSLFYKMDVETPIQMTGIFKDSGRKTLAIKPILKGWYSADLPEDEIPFSTSLTGDHRESDIANGIIAGLDFFCDVNNAQSQYKLVYETIRSPSERIGSSSGWASVLVSGEKVKLFPIKLFPATRLNEKFAYILRETVLDRQTGPLVETLKVFDPRIQGITTAVDYVAVDVGLPKLQPLQFMGDGVIKAVLILGGINNYSGGMLLIDEIDNGVHASALKAFWLAIAKAAREHDVQIFATTHNWESLAMLKLALEEDETLMQDLAMYKMLRPKNHENGDEILSYRYNYTELAASIEADLEIR